MLHRVDCEANVELIRVALQELKWNGLCKVRVTSLALVVVGGIGQCIRESQARNRSCSLPVPNTQNLQRFLCAQSLAKARPRLRHSCAC